MIPLGFQPCLQTVPTARAMQCTLTCLRMVYMAFMRSSSWTSMFMVMLYTNIDMTPYNHQWLEEWSTEILREAGLLASKRSDIPFQYADYMTGGMDEKILTRQNRHSLLPKDLGTWTADPFAAFYVDDAISD